MSIEVQHSFSLDDDGSACASSVKKTAPSQYLDQLKATIECDRRVHALISLYTELQQRVEAIEVKVANLSH